MGLLIAFCWIISVTTGSGGVEFVVVHCGLPRVLLLRGQICGIWFVDFAIHSQSASLRCSIVGVPQVFLLFGQIFGF